MDFPDGRGRERLPRNAPTTLPTVLHEQFARLTRQIRNVELPDGMTQERLSALVMIDRYGPISVTSLADLRAGATCNHVENGDSALVNEGLARRHEDSKDGRGVLVTTTAKGRRAFVRANEHRMDLLLRNALNGSERSNSSPPWSRLASALERLSELLNDRVAVSRMRTDLVAIRTPPYASPHCAQPTAR
jgi:DNA-binding MarR family transcriptional regulator